MHAVPGGISAPGRAKPCCHGVQGVSIGPMAGPISPKLCSFHHYQNLNQLQISRILEVDLCKKIIVGKVLCLLIG